MFWVVKKKGKKITSQTGFEPAHAEHNALAGRRLNHSATGTLLIRLVKKLSIYDRVKETFYDG